MGVSVSFSGGGKHRSFDLTGVPTGEAETFLGNRKKKAIIPDNIRRAMHPQPIDPTVAEKEGKVKLNAFDMRPDTLDKKTMPGSAVIASATGLCLEGEQTNPVVLGTKFYSSHNGKKGFHSISELDPSASPARVGVLGEGKEGADTAESQEGTPSAFQVSSRLVMETDDLGRKVLVEYDKDIETTPFGRFAKVTGERRRIVGIVSENKKDKPHPFEVRYDRGWMIWLPSEELLTYNNSAISITDNLLAKGGIHKDGWYKVDSILPKEGGSLYLNIEKGDSESEGDSETITASFADASGGDISILISETTLDPVTWRTEVRASVTSAIRLGGGSGETLHPYKVRFSEEFWSWEIYLPTEECFVIGDVPTSVTGNLEPSPAENGWYILAIPEDASEIRLNGELGSDSELTLSFSDSSNDPANYPNRFSYLIAKLGAHCVIGQNITSAIHRGGRQVWVDPGDGETA